MQEIATARGLAMTQYLGRVRDAATNEEKIPTPFFGVGIFGGDGGI